MKNQYYITARRAGLSDGKTLCFRDHDVEMFEIPLRLAYRFSSYVKARDTMKLLVKDWSGLTDWQVVKVMLREIN